MAERLDDQSADAEWSDAVLDGPGGGRVDSSAGQRFGLFEQLAGETGGGSHRTFSAV
jgi:hypothetical protein